MNEIIDLQTQEEAAAHILEAIPLIPKLIRTEDENVRALAWKRDLADRRKRVVAFFEALRKPQRASLKTLNDTEKGILQPITDNEPSVDRLLMDYRQKQQATAQKQQEAETTRYEKRLDKAAEKGKDLDTVRPPVQIKEPAKTQGGVTFRKVVSFEIIDEAQIPETYWLKELNTMKIRTDVRNGMVIPGVQRTETEQPV